MAHPAQIVEPAVQRMPLQGKFALVTGSSRGIGRGIALRLADRGATVAINYVENEAAGQATLAEVRERGAEAILIRADVSRPDELTRLVARVHETFGALDVFVHNALGNLLGFLSPPLAMTLDQWDEAFQVQPRAFFVGMGEVAKLVRDGGRIVALSYWPEAMLAWLRSGWAPTGRPTRPADIGGAVATLCSDDAGWITGQTIIADGGASLMNPEVPLDFQRP